MSEDITISRRFCGPPNSGNGGYVSGMLAKTIHGDAQVTLHAPPPLDTPLKVRHTEEGVELYHDELKVGSARHYDFEMELPFAPDPITAQTAEKRFEGFTQHNLPNCFVCGTQRTAGDGLRIFAGQLDDQPGHVAAVWQPDPSLADENGRIRDEFLWAALDCPGYFAVKETAGVALLGQYAVKLLQPVYTDDVLVVSGWSRGNEGRKHYAGTALFREDGAVVGYAEATWISLKKAAA